MLIKLSYPTTEFVHRQTPGCHGLWKDAQFIAGEPGAALDGWVVYERLEQPLTAECDPARTIFITGEPNSVRGYDPRFLAQFGAVITPNPGLEHPRVFQQQPAIPWWVGITIDNQPSKGTSSYWLDYDQLTRLTHFEKPRLLSVLCSRKAVTEGHRQRLRLLEALVAHFGDDLEVFGHGFRTIEDKWQAIHPFRYHLVLENVRADHYWTEKLADTYLAGAFPLYCGCPNLHQYFSPDSYRMIDRTDPQGTIETISRAIAEGRYERSIPALQEARERVLNRYNLFQVVLDVLAQLPASKPVRMTLRPECDFTDPILKQMKRRARRLFQRLA